MKNWREMKSRRKKLDTKFALHSTSDRKEGVARQTTEVSFLKNVKINIYKKWFTIFRQRTFIFWKTNLLFPWFLLYSRNNETHALWKGFRLLGSPLLWFHVLSDWTLQLEFHFLPEVPYENRRNTPYFITTFWFIIIQNQQSNSWVNHTSVFTLIKQTWWLLELQFLEIQFFLRSHSIYLHLGHVFLDQEEFGISSKQEQE